MIRALRRLYFKALRDLFAAQALHALIVDPAAWKVSQLPGMAYDLSDKMLAARREQRR